MADELKLDWSALVNLMPICLKFRDQIQCGEAIDLRSAANDVGAALGVSDIDQFAVQKIRAAMESGLEGAFDSRDTKELAKLFAANARPVMQLTLKFVKGDITSSGLIANLNDLCFGNVESIQKVLQRSLGVSGEAADFLASKLGPYLTSIYAFAAAYRIYERAAQDATLAHERRLEIEKLANESIAELKEQRSEMEHFVESSLLDQLEPFDEGMKAMAQAVLENSDDEYIVANTGLWQLFGREVQYETTKEFDSLMLSEDAFRL